MHERTRKAVSRLLFVFCCAVPTAITLVVVCLTQSSWYRSRLCRMQADAMSIISGTQVEIASFQQISPTEFAYENVTLTDPESGEVIASVRKVQIHSGTDATTIEFSQPKIASKYLPEAMEVIDKRFMRLPDAAKKPLHVYARDLTIHSVDKHQVGGDATFREVNLHVESNRQETEAVVRLTPAWIVNSKSILLKFNRDRVTEPARSSWQLSTGSTALPCDALIGITSAAGSSGDWLAAFGHGAQLRGSIRVDWDEKGTYFDLSQCRIDEISLDRLAGHGGHRLSGTASIEFEKGVFWPGKKIIADGRIVAFNGMISGSLLEASRRYLNFQTIPNPQDQPFDLMAFRFQIRNVMATIVGDCKRETGYDLPGTVLISNGRAIARSTPGGFESVKLASLFAPRHAVEGLISAQNHWLYDWLLPPPHEVVPASFEGTLHGDPRFPSPAPPILRTATATDRQPELIQPR